MRTAAWSLMLVLLVVPVTGCSQASSARSLLGGVHRPAPMADSVRDQHEAQLDAAEAAWGADPTGEDAIIWLGRRQAYLGRYEDAIETFTVGLEHHPDSYKLRRHRGHRYLTTRRLDRAETDLEDAATLAVDSPDEIEPDGLPNDLGIPTSTSHTNIWYHLGLAYYTLGYFEAALDSYLTCMSYSTNPDMTVATAYWTYLCQRRLGLDDDAAATLTPITPDLEVIENDAYHRLCLLYRGDLDIDDIARPDEPDAVQSATVAYGVARWYAMEGDPETATAKLWEIVDGDTWAAFGYLAAEADLWRMGVE